MRSITTTVLAAALLATPALLAPSAQAEPDRTVHVFEKMTSLEINGMTGTYSYTIHDTPDGPVIGQTTGYCTVFFQDPGTKEMYSYCDDTMSFHGGTLHSFGVINMTTAYAGVPITLGVNGTGGEFGNRLGTRYWVAKSEPSADSRSQIFTATSDFTFMS
ncbi:MULTISPECIES: hypothetical protein [unclassified Nocardia]|uniref:allene oxide cyclase barrel-like domain-containing protein n=1 Tax=unclassified Nocardia TaxID=2637762 RepID=UPI0035D95561